MSKQVLWVRFIMAMLLIFGARLVEGVLYVTTSGLWAYVFALTYIIPAAWYIAHRPHWNGIINSSRDEL